MSALGYHLSRKAHVRISFLGDKSAEIDGRLRTYDEHHLVLVHEGELKIVPCTAVGAVTVVKQRPEDEAEDNADDSAEDDDFDSDRPLVI